MLTRYDFMSLRELKQEAKKRFGTNTGQQKLIINQRETKYKYRLAFIKDDIEKGIDPFLKIELPK